jgi:hypothetical protein
MAEEKTTYPEPNAARTPRTQSAFNFIINTIFICQRDSKY